MSVLFSMLPFYLVGNLHCLGMCGPLVMMIGQHRYAYFYFMGRLIAFTLAGMLAGGIGAIAQVFLSSYHLTALASFICGGFILFLGVMSLMRRKIALLDFLAKKLAPLNESLALLMLQDRIWPTFLFGFFTIALPCGQSLIVLSACALSGNMGTGMLNGFVFALLTSPSLFLAMRTHIFLRLFRPYYHSLMGGCAVLVGCLACCRGMAELGLISHFILNPDSPSQYHIILY